MCIFDISRVIQVHIMHGAVLVLVEASQIGFHSHPGPIMSPESFTAFRFFFYILAFLFQYGYLCYTFEHKIDIFMCWMLRTESCANTEQRANL